MKVAISGAHSQGKTTLLNALKDSGLLNDFEFKTSLTRGLQEAGFNINEDGDDVTQVTIMAKHLQRLNEKGNIVYDRCALDGYAYSMALVKDLKVLGGIRELFYAMIDRYDIIFYVEPELPLVEDGQRTVNRDFFESIVQSFQAIIQSYKVPVIRISGSVEDRVMQVLNSIERWETQKYEYNNEPYEL
jgi:nicotinamide riboside kinase